MDKQYKIGDFDKFFQISADTLRFYEKAGLIKPVLTEGSKYRKYHYDHFGRIAHLRELRYMGFSIKELQELWELESTNQYLEALDRKHAENEALIQQLQESNEALELRRRNLAAHLKKRGTSEIIDIPPLRYVPHIIRSGQENTEHIEENFKTIAGEQGWRALIDSSAIAVCFKEEHLLNPNNNEHSWGLVINAKKISIDTAPKDSVPAVSCLVLYPEDYISIDNVQSLKTLAINACKKENCTVMGDAYFLLLHSLEKEDPTKLLGVFFVPVEQNK